MAGISSLGIGSGLDLTGLVQKLVAAEGEVTTARLDRREAMFQAKLSALGIFKSALTDFRLAQKGLIANSEFQTISAKSGNESLFTVTADSDADIGHHSIEIQSLAGSHTLASKAFASDSEIVGIGTLTFRFGAYDSGTNTFSVNPQKATQSVTIDSTNNTLSGIRDAINNADLGIRASIVDDGTGYRMVFSSLDTGLENSLEITVDNDQDANNLDDSGLSQLAYDPVAPGSGSGKNLTETIAAKDAQLVVDGLTIRRPENTIDGVLQGITVILKSAAPGTSTDLTITKDSESVATKVQQFVESFNTLIDSLDQLSHYDVESGHGGPLLGDSLVRGIETRIRSIVTARISGLSGHLMSLADIGITTQKDGTLKLDSSKLQAAVDSDPDEVARLFSESGKSPDSLLRFSGAQPRSAPGEYPINITQLATQGNYSGAVIGGMPLAIDGTNDTLSIRVDGVDSGVIQLTQGTYTTGDQFAGELQSQINRDPALMSADASVTVNFQSGQIYIASNRYGGESSVEITSVGAASAATLGLAPGAGTTGVDVAGTIGGVQATGAGQTLTGTGSASGVSVEVLGGSVGYRGEVSFSHGVSAQLDRLISEFLDQDSVIDSRINSLNKRISDVGEQRAEQSRRLSSYQARLISQFTALDSLLSRLQTTNAFLTQQLSSLPGSLKQEH